MTQMRQIFTDLSYWLTQSEAFSRHPDLSLRVIPTEVEGSLDKLEMTWRHSETLRLRSG